MNVPAVRVAELAYTFAGRTSPTLAGIDFVLEQGTWTLLAGRTGAGKSTVLRALAGLIPHHTAGAMQGTVELMGLDTRRATSAELARTVGLVLQAPDDQICTTSVAAEVAFGLENLAVPAIEIGGRIAAALARVKLEEYSAARTAHLSGGQKQRLLLASILAMEPQILLLDEPLSQLDPASAAELLTTLAALQRQGMTIVTVEHRLDEIITYADRMLVIDEGLLVADVAASDTRAVHAALTAHDLDPPQLVELAVRTGQEIKALGVSSETFAPPVVQEREPSHHVSTNRLLRVENLTFRFDRRSAPLWQSLHFSLRSGERVALVGPNGSGKSTLLAVLAGLLSASEGEVDLSAFEPGRAACGLVLQNPDLMLFCSTVHDELAFGPRQLDLAAEEIERRVMSLATALDLTSHLDQVPMALSQGERLRTAVAATMTLSPRVLMLDEPTTGQDLRQVERVLQSITTQLREHRSVDGLLFATHDVRTVARYADRVLVLGSGQLLADCTPEVLLADDGLLAMARLRRTPLLELRKRRGWRGWTAAELAMEMLDE